MVTLLFDKLPPFYTAVSALLVFVLTFVLSNKLKHKLPVDKGRAYAVNAERQKEKPEAPASYLFRSSVYSHSCLHRLMWSIPYISYSCSWL